MKKRTLKIALAVTTVLGAGSVATGSTMLARMGFAGLGTVPASDNVKVTQKAAETLDRQAARANQVVARASVPEPEVVVAAPGHLHPAMHDAGPAAPVERAGYAGYTGGSRAEGGGTTQASPAAAAAMRGVSTPAGGGSLPAAGGRAAAHPAATAAPSEPVAAPATTGSPAQVAEPTAGSNTPTGPVAPPPETVASTPSASVPALPASPEGGKDSKPTDIVSVISPPTGADPSDKDHIYGIDDLPVTPPSLDLSKPAEGPVVVAANPTATPGSGRAVPEPSTLALFGMAALALVARRRKQAATRN